MKKVCFLFLASCQLYAATIRVPTDQSTINAAIAAASCGDVIEVDVATYTGASTAVMRLKNQTGCNGKFTHIRSANASALPVGRVGPADAVNMPALRVSGLVMPIVNVDTALTGCGANNYIVEGFDIGTTGTQDEVLYLIQLLRQTPGGDSFVSSNCTLPSNMVFRKNYIHTPVTLSNTTKNLCFNADVDGLTLEDNYFEGCFSAATSNQEAKAIVASQAINVHYIKNNHIEGSSIGSLYGGAQCVLMGCWATQIYTGNHYYKPWAWRRTTGTTDPTGACLWDARGGEAYNQTSSNHWWLCVSGTWVDQGAGTSTQAWAPDKNAQEIKNTKNSVSEGNLAEHGWYPTLQSQHGSGLLLNLVDNGDIGIANVLYKNNKIKDTPWCYSQGGGGIGNYYTPYNIYIVNNLCLNTGNGLFSNGGNPISDGVVLQTTVQGRMKADHNTWIMNPYTNSGGPMQMNSNANAYEIAYTNNIVSWGNRGFYCNNLAGSGNLWNAVPGCFSFPSVTWGSSVIVNDFGCTNFGNPCSVVNLRMNSSVQAYTPVMGCAGCLTPANWTTVDMVNYQADGTGDYRLNPTSPYYLTGNQGTSIGANIDEVEWSTSNAISGVPNPYLEMQVLVLNPSTTTASFRAIAYNTEACTLTVSLNRDRSSPFFTNTTSTGDRDRSISITGMTSGRLNYGRWDCTSSHYLRDFVYWSR